MSIQDCFATSNSMWIVVSICAISALTNTESRSPSAWYLTKISKASSLLSLLIRKRGLSGRKLREDQRLLSSRWSLKVAYKIKVICTKEGQHCNKDGIRQPQSLLIFEVSTTIPAAIKEPTNHDALNMEVMIARSLGYDSSPSIADPDTMQKTIPNPRIIRATIYMPAKPHQYWRISGRRHSQLTEKPWMIAPTH